MLAELDLDESQGQPGSVHRHLEVPQDVRERADMILVTVCDEERLDLAPFLEEVGGIGDDEVDSRHAFFGKHHAAIDDDNAVSVLENGHILTDLTDAAERDDSKLWLS